MLTKRMQDPLSMPCWIWARARDENGYGTVYDGRRMVGAHRWLYEKLVGPVPEGLELDHLCRNPSCVNPDHLDAVTHAVNVARGVGPRKLSMDQAEAIRSDHAHGVAMSVLAKHHGVSHEAIRQVIKFITYRPEKFGR